MTAVVLPCLCLRTCVGGGVIGRCHAPCVNRVYFFNICLGKHWQTFAHSLQRVFVLIVVVDCVWAALDPEQLKQHARR